MDDDSTFSFDKFMNEIIEKEETKTKKLNESKDDDESWGRKRDIRYREYSQNRIKYTR